MNQTAFTRLELKSLTPLASGYYRDIYQHPHEEKWLVKVVKQSVLNEPVPWHKSLFGYGPYKTQSRELKQYRSLTRRNLHDLPFIQRYYGKVDTDLGVGMVVEKLKGRDGGLAPTITELAKKNGVTQEIRDRFRSLRDDIIRHNIVFTDVKGSNIVVAHERNEDRLVVIDGLGDRLWLPVNAWSAKINQLNRWRHFERALMRLEKEGW